MLRAGIVGLPNVGKSTLFNALTRTRKAEAANYPFCTIEPNVGVVPVPEPRLQTLARISKTSRIVPTSIEIVDIAGLVRGASKGEGLGNKFLQHIREVDAIVEVVRCFEDKDIVHVAGDLDPVADIETVKTELALADLETVGKTREKAEKAARGGEKEAQASLAVAEKLAAHLNSGRRALTLPLSPDEQEIAGRLFLLTSKPILFAANVAEEGLAGARFSEHVSAVRRYAETHLGTEAVAVSARIESELADLSEEEAREYLANLGVAESGVGALIRATYHLLGLRTFFTASEKEARAWTIHAGQTAPAAAGVIHSDFERGFIKAETVSYEGLAASGSMTAAR
ncbi:MAG TPA: redox-regulated ATPase YchF, partial [Thermoanaerobaculia bacterium]|nr:redox-regulated ATPase YchF [Thermoanaerobaculia bacterium]